MVPVIQDSHDPTPLISIGLQREKLFPLSYSLASLERPRKKGIHPDFFAILFLSCESLSVVKKKLVNTNYRNSHAR